MKKTIHPFVKSMGTIMLKSCIRSQSVRVNALNSRIKLLRVKGKKTISMNNDNLANHYLDILRIEKEVLVDLKNQLSELNKNKVKY